MQKLIASEFIAVAADDWFERRRQDAVGEFFRKMADQGPRKGADGGTRQGIYCLTADGTLLSYKNAGQNADVTLDFINAGLAAWRKLPAARRKPGAIRIGERGKVDERFAPKLPAGGQALRTFTRQLTFGVDGKIAPLECAKGKGDQSGRDSLWLSAADLAELLKPSDKPIPFPPKLANRIARFHLVDNTRGEPPFWQERDVRSVDWKLTPIRTAGAGRIAWRASGTFEFESFDGSRGYRGELLGDIELDSATKRIVGCTLTAFGKHRGEGTYTRGAPVGDTPLAVCFDLPPASDRTAETVPPQGIRERDEYLPRN